MLATMMGRFLKYFMATLLLTSYCYAATNVQGIISTDTTWTAVNSPYEIVSDVQIAENITLTIQPGVVVKNGNIRVWGTLSAIGTEASRIQFEYVHIMPGENSTESDPFLIDIRFCRMSYGRLYYPTGNEIYGSLILRDSIISDIEYLYLWYPVSDCYIERNIFRRCGGIDAGIDDDVHVYVTNNVFIDQQPSYGSTFAVASWATYADSEVIVKHNSFLNTDRVAVKLLPGYDSARMIASENYWNTTDDATIQSMIFDKNDDLACAGYIQYKPILTSPHNSTPIPIEDAPSADFMAGSTQGIAPFTVAFSNLSSGDISAYLWNFGDGGTSSQQNPSHTYQTSGIFTVSLTVTGSGGSDTESKTAYISVDGPTPASPVAGFQANPTSGTAPLSVVFTNQSTGQISTYLWDFGDGTTSAAFSPTHTYSAGAYTVTLTVQGSGGSDTMTRTAYVNVDSGQIALMTGIWKSSDGVLTLYVQKYQTGSCIIVVTMGDGVLTGFLDSNHANGIEATDVYAVGYNLSLTLTDSTHGTLTVTLPGWGQVVTPVECKFPDTQ